MKKLILTLVITSLFINTYSQNGEKIVKAKGYYVPDFLAIDDSGYGDYIIMIVDKDGKINNWRFDSEPFTNEYED